jgi:hypothetical protein
MIGVARDVRKDASNPLMQAGCSNDHLTGPMFSRILAQPLIRRTSRVSARMPRLGSSRSTASIRLALLAVLCALGVLTGCTGRRFAPLEPAAAAAALPAQDAAPRAASASFRSTADAAVSTLEGAFYHAPGRWNACVPGTCGTVVRDWGADTLADVLAFRWRVARDPSIVPVIDAMTQATPTYGSCERGKCSMWSDIPMWDSVADARAFAVTGAPLALEKARRAFALVDGSNAFGLGACPSIDFQQPAGGKTALKTLETDSNYIRAALLLHGLTGEPGYLAKARAKYAAVRRYFLDPLVPLYSVYVFDNGAACTQLPQRFFASVNGNMIDNGLMLAAQTGAGSYRRDALATARAVVHDLSDDSGVYANLQADNDVAQPLVEAMYDLATAGGQRFARRWLIAAATVAQPAPSGAYGRFFDGPPPQGPISAWSANGGLALAVAAGALDPTGAAGTRDYWARARYIADPLAAAPAAISFTGRAIALIGTIGEVCCEAGHIRVFIDGKQTFNHTGIWQNKSPASHALPNSVLFSWRWSRSERHTITLEPGLRNPKEGGSFIHLAGYEVVP